MSWVAVGVGGASIAASIFNSSQNKPGAVSLPSPQSVDIPSLGKQAAAADISQIQAGLAAEREFLPGQQELRTGGVEALTAQLFQQLPAGLQERLQRDFFAEAPQLEGATPRLLEEVERQRFEDLTLGGELSPEVASQIRREAGIKGARVGVLPVAGGVSTQTQRDLTARDIGISATALRSQRQAAAEATGGRQQSFADAINRTNVALKQQQAGQRQGIFDLLGVSQSRETGRIGSIFQAGQQAQVPTIGLGGSDVANLTLSNIQQANQFALAEAGVASGAAASSAAGSDALSGSLLKGGFSLVGQGLSKS